MNQADIETFLMLVKTRNITKTAESLFVSQPTVSHRLKLLEEELDVPLLIRKKGYKKVELTPKGEEFIPIAQRWLSLMKETMLLKNAGEELYLSVASTDTLNSCIFKDLYRSILRDTRINMKLNISTHYSYEIYELLEKRTVDVGFVYHHLHYKNIISEPVLREKMYVVQEWDSAIRKNQINIDELDPEKEVTFLWETNYQIWHEQMVSKGRRNSLEVDIYSLFSEFLKDKGRWAIAPVTVVNRLQNEQKIKTLNIFEERINQYFTDSGLDRYMDRYTAAGI